MSTTSNNPPGNNLAGSKRKNREPTTLDSKIVFDDEVDMKLLLLSLFAHDPCHDFSGGRVNKSDIFSELNNMFEILHAKTNEPQTVFISVEPDVVVLESALHEYIDTTFIPEFTNIIVSGGITEAIHTLSMYTKNAITSIQSTSQSSIESLKKLIYDNILEKLKNQVFTQLSGYEIFKNELYRVLSISYGGSVGTATAVNPSSVFRLPSVVDNKPVDTVNYDVFFNKLPDALDGAETAFKDYLYTQIKEQKTAKIPFNIYTQLTQKGGKKQHGGTPEELRDFAYETNKTTLTEIVRWVLLYLDCAKEPSGILLPKFADIPNTDDTKSLAKHYILNVQILIMYDFYLKNTNANVDTLDFLQTNILNGKTFQNYFSNNLFNQNTIQEKWFTNKIDESIKNASEIIINKMFLNNVLYTGEPDDLLYFLNLPSETSGNQYIINNAANISNIPNLKSLVYCPVTSIVDPMSQCPYSKTKMRAIYATKLHISNTSNTYTYYVNMDFKENQQNPSVHIKGEVKVPSDLTIEIDKEVSINRLPRPELSVGMVYKDMIKNISNILKNSSTNTNTSPRFIRTITKDIIEGLCVKSIGDWGQEVTSIARFGAYAGTDLDDLDEINNAMTSVSAIPYDESGQAKRLGVAGDRPSAFRMIYMCLFANPDYINRQAAVGYMTHNHSNDFIVYTPPIESDTQHPKKRKGGGTKRKHNLKKSRTRKLKRKRKVSRRNTPIIIREQRRKIVGK
jgi:hypothetical protein